LNDPQTSREGEREALAEQHREAIHCAGPIADRADIPRQHVPDRRPHRFRRRLVGRKATARLELKIEARSCTRS